MLFREKINRLIPEKHKGTLYFMMLFALVVPIKRIAVIPYIILAWFIWWIIFQKHKWEYLRKNLKGNNVYIFIFIAVYYLIHCISLIYTDNLKTGMASIERLTSFAAIAFLVFSANIIDSRKSFSLIFHAFMTGCIIASFYVLFEVFTGQAGIIKKFQFFNIYHHTYFSLYLNFAIVLALYYSKKQNRLALFHPVVYLFTVFFWLFMIFMLLSRAGILSSVFVLLGWLGYELFSKSKLTYIHVSIITAFSIVLFSISFAQHKNLSLTWKQLSKISLHEKTYRNSYYLVRLRLWDATCQVIKRNMVLGVGCGDVKQEIAQEFENNEALLAPRKRKYNAHNQYLETFAATGIIGILSLLGIFISGFIKSLRQRNYLFLAFLILTGFNFLFESMLNRLMGILFFSFFFCLFVIMKDKKETGHQQE